MNGRWLNRTVNVGEPLRARVLRRSKTTGRCLSAELRFLARLGVSLLSPPTGEKEGASPLIGPVDRPDAEPDRKTWRIGLHAPLDLWEDLERLADACGWLRIPRERAWRGGPLLLRGRPSHLSRALRVAVAAGLDAVQERPALDPAPRARRAYARALRRAWGDWQVKPEEDFGGSPSQGGPPEGPP